MFIIQVTREYLRSIKQGETCLPDGPLLLNPTSLLRAFHREIIEKKPEEFKIQCLADIKALFPAGSNPFYAGYGNRVNVSFFFKYRKQTTAACCLKMFRLFVYYVTFRVNDLSFKRSLRVCEIILYN